MRGWGKSQQAPSVYPSLTPHLLGLFFFLLFLLVIISFAGWVGFTQYKARKAGLPPPTWKHYVPFMKSSQSTTNYPTPRSSNPIEWLKDQFSKIRNPRSARGAYEETNTGGYTPSSARGRGRGFEDDTWDTRVGGAHDDPYAAPGQGYAANYDEQELGLAPAGGLQAEPYGGASDYDTSRARDNPFGDQNEAPSLRSVSPRPEMDPNRGHRPQMSADSASYEGGGGGGSLGSPTGTRKSAFREGI